MIYSKDGLKALIIELRLWVHTQLRTTSFGADEADAVLDKLTEMERKL